MFSQTAAANFFTPDALFQGPRDLSGTLKQAHLVIGGRAEVVASIMGGFAGPQPRARSSVHAVLPRAAARSTEFFEAYLAAARTIDVATPRNGAVFWSGSGNRELAEKFAAEHGKLILEMTPGGKWLDSRKLFEAGSPLTREQAVQVWATASKRFSEQASGIAVGFSTGSDPASIFNTLEFPTLLRNPNVCYVVTGGY